MLRFTSQPLAFCMLLLALEAHAEIRSDLKPRTIELSPSSNVHRQLQTLLIEAVPGDTIVLSEGTFLLKRSLDVSVDNITIRGAGSDQTVLSFKGQLSGGQGIRATGNNLVMEGFAVEDTSGNAIKVNGARNVTFRDVRTEWTGPPLSSNGAYGIYPVQCQNVLLEGCSAYGASDAGIYVGQCRQVIVRRCRAERNVAGIEIENTIDADVYENVARNNAGGLLVFDLPGLEVKNGRNIRVFNNRVVDNNHSNFAAPGNIVAGVPSGTGLMVMATDRVEIFENKILNNQTSSVSIVSFFISSRKSEDPNYDPFPEAISIFNNDISGGGKKPQGGIGDLLSPHISAPFPTILYDGVVNPAKLRDGKIQDEFQHEIHSNGDKTTFLNFDLAHLDASGQPTKEHEFKDDLSSYSVHHDRLQPIVLKEHEPPNLGSTAAISYYLKAKRKLSDYQLFEGALAKQRPQTDVFQYEMNTALFSDYAAKRRFIKIPSGTRIQYRPDGVFEFPVGSILAKTFSYPNDERKPELGERIIETRIEIREAEGWYGFSYEWNEEQTDATLQLGGSEQQVSWIDSNGREMSIDYLIPNANECLTCHTRKKQYVPIGPTAANLNLTNPAGKDLPKGQLAAMAKAGLLEGLPRQDIPKMPVWDREETGSCSERARAWLSVNCAHCHQPGGTARTSGLDLRYSQTDSAKYGVWKTPVAAGHGSGGRAYDIVPGKPDESILMFRLESTDPSIMMPNISKSTVPQEAVALVRQWISEMD